VNSKNVENPRKWAQFRFAVVGGLLSSPLDADSLQDRIGQLAAKVWKHPITGEPHAVKFSTIERWYYQAKSDRNPVDRLQRKVRRDSGNHPSLPIELKQALGRQYQVHQSWNWKLHADNLRVVHPKECPSYDTVRRYMKSSGLLPKKRTRNFARDGAKTAAARFDSREVRSYEVSYVGGLWHLDYHGCSRQVLTRHAQWVVPKLCTIMDDHSRLACHAQWYLSETTEDLVHCYIQALLKRHMPRRTMSDNGSAMTSAEFTSGLAALSIVHDTTLPYSPWQNGKQEYFFSRVESRLMPMLEAVKELDLKTLNDATQAWVEREYNHTVNEEIGATPYDRFKKSPNVSRGPPSIERLKLSFCLETDRRQRRSDGTVSVEGRRFEVPGRYHLLEVITVRYARWDLSRVDLIDPRTGTILAPIYPLDRTANATRLSGPGCGGFGAGVEKLVFNQFS